MEEQASARANPFTLRQRIALWWIAAAGSMLVRLIGCTLRFSFVAESGSFSGRGTPPPEIFCFWHRAVIPAAWVFRNRQAAVMTSRSFDGEYIARIIAKLGFIPVRGSSSRGGVGALIGMRWEIEKGHPVAFTIDGPRGPVYVAKPGPVLLAKKTGRPITCFYVAPERAWVLNSWDRMMIPKPFSRVVGYFCSPIPVPPDATDAQMEALHQQMQESLDRSRLQAEERLKKLPELPKSP
ncbi:MAG: lysophospholipid acyltransferase family protein [Acidobacteriia bacterium]|nr:lysophospholipid acyltransferase family protein [Terriglobia bacterium]